MESWGKMVKILYLVVNSVVWYSLSSLEVVYLHLSKFFDGETELDHYIFYKPPPNPWFKG